MATEALAPELVRKAKPESTIVRVAKYTAVRLLALFATTVVGVYLTILIANMGGYVDILVKADIREQMTQIVISSQANRQLSPEARTQMINDRVALEEKRQGLDQPFITRSFKYLTNALTLQLGRAVNMTSDAGSKTVRLILLERLPATLLLAGTSEMFLFFFSVFIALILSRKYGSFWDKAIIGLSPASSAPPWFYGIFFIVIFAAIFRVLPFGGLIDSPPPTGSLGYALSVLKHLILPASAIVISSLFLSIYNWRTYFLIFSSEDYVEMARAKGLSDRDIERRYILRPTMPTIITNFALLLIILWQGFTITEAVFQWPGLGRTLYQAIGFRDTPVIVGSTVIYAYMLAITVFLLDIVYALIDPRVKVGGAASGGSN
ncbi:MAG: ABC transporter permease [Anaerolineales bacterium]